MRTKNSNSKLTSPFISKPAGNPFFRNTLKLLCLIALLQVGASLILLSPKFLMTAMRLLAHKNSTVAENSILLPTPNKISSPSSHPDVNKPRNDAITKSETTLIPGNNVQPGASLSIIDIRHTHGSLGEQALKIAIKSQTQEPISIPDVKVQVYFYDQQGPEIVPSKSPVTSRWVRSPVEWKNGEPEILEVIYQPDVVTPDLYYVGYIVAVYYKGELQSYRADPVKLTSQFPIKVFIGPSEI